jgi:hypothetical protein
MCARKRYGGEAAEKTAVEVASVWEGTVKGRLTTERTAPVKVVVVEEEEEGDASVCPHQTPFITSPATWCPAGTADWTKGEPTITLLRTQIVIHDGIEFP